MSRSDPDLRYLERTPAAADYVRQISAQQSDRGTRSAFRDLVLRTAPPGARLFDFGAGPGMDARFFADRGFSIDAYDVDPRMRAFFADHCRDHIEAGRVTLDGRGYREFLTGGTDPPARPADLIISNFAPLNLVDDLRELFAKFDSISAPTAKVIASVLNPCFIGDMRSRQWWRGARRLWRDGELFLPGPQAPYYRRLLGHFRAMSAPHFRLSRIFRGVPTSREGQRSGIDAGREGRFAWLQVASCRYMFLLFEKPVAP